MRAGGEATFRRHPVRVRGLLVRCGRRERMTTTTSDGPPNDDEKVDNVGKLWAHATIFFAIKLKTLIEMSAWCMCAFISVVMAVLFFFRHHHGLYALTG